MIMGIATTLYEEKIMDNNLGHMLNPNMDFYRLAGYGDVGELVVHMMTGKGYDERGPIGPGRTADRWTHGSDRQCRGQRYRRAGPVPAHHSRSRVNALNPKGGSNATV